MNLMQILREFIQEHNEQCTNICNPSSFFSLIVIQEGNDQEKGATKKKLPLQKTEAGKTKLTIRYLYIEDISYVE